MSYCCCRIVIRALNTRIKYIKKYILYWQLAAATLQHLDIFISFWLCLNVLALHCPQHLTSKSKSQQKQQCIKWKKSLYLFPLHFNPSLTTEIYKNAWARRAGRERSGATASPPVVNDQKWPYHKEKSAKKYCIFNCIFLI